jgi:adenine-specific DNA glycosylase
VPQQKHDSATWHRLPGVVTHVFTHFPLELIVYTGEVPVRTAAPKGMRWVLLDKLSEEALPNVMRKVVARAIPSWPGLSPPPRLGGHNARFIGMAGIRRP